MMEEKRYFRLGTTGGAHDPKIGEEFNYMGIYYKIVDIEPTDLKTGVTIDGVRKEVPMFYLVMKPIRPSEDFKRFNPGEFDYWKGQYFPEYPPREKDKDERA